METKNLSASKLRGIKGGGVKYIVAMESFCAFVG